MVEGVSAAQLGRVYVFILTERGSGTNRASRAVASAAAAGKAVTGNAKRRAMERI